MTSSIREKKTKRSPAMTTADVVAVVHLLVANVVYFVGQYTRVFSGMSLVEPGKMLVYHYIDYPVFVALEFIFRTCSTMFGSLPFISFIGPWFDWFFLDTDDLIFQTMHAEFVIVSASLFYGICAYFLARLFLMVFGLDDD